VCVVYAVLTVHYTEAGGEAVCLAAVFSDIPVWAIWTCCHSVCSEVLNVSHRRGFWADISKGYWADFEKKIEGRFETILQIVLKCKDNRVCFYDCEFWWECVI